MKLCLIADDHPIILEKLPELARQSLNGQGNDVEFATFRSGELLLDYALQLKTQNKVPDLTICDLSMISGKMTGIDTCERFRNLFPNAPFYIFTTYQKGTYKTRDVQATGYLDKIEREELVKIIRKHLG